MKINAVFEGGGMKGISLVGAVHAVMERRITFDQLAGTSSGAIIASLLAAGYTAVELKRIVQTTSFSQFMQRSAVFNIKGIGPAIRLILYKGLYSGQSLEAWIRQLLLAKGIATFGDLPEGKLRLIASDITNAKLLVLPDDIAPYGISPRQLEIAKAVRMSASIPYFFDPVIIKARRMNSRIQGVKPARKSGCIVDGALLSNFPLWLFNDQSMRWQRSSPVIGFQMVGKNDRVPREIRGPFSMFQAMMETMMLVHDERYIEKDKRDRTVKIPSLGIRTTQFDLTPEWSEKLFESGLRAANKFLDEHPL